MWFRLIEFDLPIDLLDLIATIRAAHMVYVKPLCLFASPFWLWSVTWFSLEYTFNI